MKRAVVVFYLAAFLLNAPALRAAAGNLAFDHPLRKPLLSLLAPFAGASETSRLWTLRAAVERFERDTLE